MSYVVAVSKFLYKVLSKQTILIVEVVSKSDTVMENIGRPVAVSLKALFVRTAHLRVFVIFLGEARLFILIFCCKISSIVIDDLVFCGDM